MSSECLFRNDKGVNLLSISVAGSAPDAQAEREAAWHREAMALAGADCDLDALAEVA